MAEKQPDAAQPSGRRSPRARPRDRKAAAAARSERWWAEKTADSAFLYYLSWGLAVLLWLAPLPIAYFAWVELLPGLWAWVDGSVLRGTAALFPSIILVFGPFWCGLGAQQFTQFMVEVSVAIEALKDEDARDEARETEEEALDRLEKDDESGLLPLLRYSRARLDIYYDIGVDQTRRSFFNAVTAMWLGFMILILGVAFYIGPVERLGLERPSQDFNVLIITSAAIVEFISALFLWVYRSTISQLTFYYRLQMHSHSSILAFRMASSMTEQDEAKRAIINSVLDTSMMPERPAVEGSRGLAALIRPALPGSAGAGRSPPAAPTPSA